MSKRKGEGSSTRRATQARSKIRYTFRTLMTGSDLSRRRLPQMCARSEQAGPVVWLTACAHGDEVGGMVVVQEVFRRLQRSPLRCGALYAFPLLNPTGFEVGSRTIALSEEDLNRSFPGAPDGSLAERMAHQIVEAILETNPAAVLDLHNDWVNSIPYTVIDPRGTAPDKAVQQSVRDLVKAIGQLPVRETDHLSRSLTYSLVRRGIPAVTLELGESHVVNELNVQVGVDAVWNALAHLGMVESREESSGRSISSKARGRTLTYSSRPLAGSSGVIRFLRRPGDLVQPGDVLARIYNAFGKLQETIVSPHDAIVLGHADSSVAFPGAPIMAFGVMKPPSSRTSR